MTPSLVNVQEKHHDPPKQVGSCEVADWYRVVEGRHTADGHFIKLNFSTAGGILPMRAQIPTEKIAPAIDLSKNASPQRSESTRARGEGELELFTPRSYAAEDPHEEH